MKTIEKTPLQTNSIAALASLDVRRITERLTEPFPSGFGWSIDQAMEAEKWYRRFLHLVIMYPKARLVPNFAIDTFWHKHILDTPAYHKDCQRIFGFYLHHCPSYGNRQAENNDQEFNETNRLFQIEFGEDCDSMTTFTAPVSPETITASANCRFCRSCQGCGPQSCGKCNSQGNGQE